MLPHSSSILLSGPKACKPLPVSKGFAVASNYMAIPGLLYSHDVGHTPRKRCPFRGNTILCSGCPMSNGSCLLSLPLFFPAPQAGPPSLPQGALSYATSAASSLISPPSLPPTCSPPTCHGSFIHGLESFCGFLLPSEPNPKSPPLCLCAPCLHSWPHPQPFSTYRAFAVPP